jgi:hypothetical protein
MCEGICNFSARFPNASLCRYLESKGQVAHCGDFPTNLHNLLFFDDDFLIPGAKASATSRINRLASQYYTANFRNVHVLEIVSSLKAFYVNGFTV